MAIRFSPNDPSYPNTEKITSNSIVKKTPSKEFKATMINEDNYLVEVTTSYDEVRTYNRTFKQVVSMFKRAGLVFKPIVL